MDDDEGGSGPVSTNVTPFPPSPYSRFLAGGTVDDDRQHTMLDGASALIIDEDSWDEAAIPRRAWVVPGFLLRGAVTVMSGPGSAGKSMLVVAQSMAIALGRPFGRFHPHSTGRVIVYNVEDDQNEQRRRFSAAMRVFGSTPVDVAGRIIRVGPAQIGTLLRVDPLTKRLTQTGALAELEALIEEKQPDAVFLDPFVELHDSDENDNTAIRAVMAKLRAIAQRWHVAVCVLHHARKGAGAMAGDPDSLRGASAIVGAARVVLTVLTMDEKEAEKLDIPPEQRRLYFRLDGAKSNYALADDAEWFQRVPYELANGETVAAAEPWEPPSTQAQVSVVDLNRALDAIDKGPEDQILYTASTRGGGSRWAGRPLMDLCGMTEKQARAQVAIWVRNGLLRETTFRHPTQRRDMPGVRVDFTKRPSV